MREGADDGFSQERAEALWRVHGVLDQLVGSDPVPFAHHAGGGVGFVQFDADDQGDVGFVIIRGFGRGRGRSGKEMY